VAGIRIPEHLLTYEDAHVIRHIKNQGYKVCVASEAYCLHYKPPTSWNVKTGFSQAIVEFKCGLVYMHLYEYMLFYPAFLLNWIFQVPLNWVRNNSTTKPDVNRRPALMKKIFETDPDKIKPFPEKPAKKTKIES
jgi:hypothetical protein